MATIEQANELYEEGLRAFRSGDNGRCISLTTESLEIGQKLKDDKIIGQALVGLCRAALRNQDEDHLQSLSKYLSELNKRTGDDWWRVVIAHMNAEMARIKGDFDQANKLYDKSMRISDAIGNENMVATECFNKSFVAVAQGNLRTANELIERHFDIRSKLDEGDINPYGLIAVANLLVAKGKIQDAAEVTYVCRRLMTEMEIIPDPADETPLKMVEEHFMGNLSKEVQDKLFEQSNNTTCRELVEKLMDP